MRLAVIHIGQETNDFNPIPTTLADFAAFGLYDGPKMFEVLKGIGQVGGHLDACAASGRQVESIPVTHAWASAGGRLDKATLDYFSGRIRDGLKAVGKFDGLHLQLHGACAAEGLDDVEGMQIALCREILGPDMPIMLGLDHHALVSREMVRHATAIVAHRTQPHNPYDTGYIGAELLMRIVAGEVKPVIAFRKLPMVTHQEQFLTSQGPMKTWFDRARAMEAEDPRVLHAGLFPMQPWLDVAEGGWAVTVTADGDQALAEKLADELAEMVWSMREDFMVRQAVPVDEAVRQADAAPAGVVVLSDTGDTVWGGAAGDSNLILESILRQGIKGKALIPLIAPPTAVKLAEAGEGATVTLKVGGESAPEFFTPLEVTGIVRKVSDGKISLPADGRPQLDMGRTVVFEVGPVTLLVSERPGAAGNIPNAYRAFGIEPADYKMAVLKTASNFQFFKPISPLTVRADTRGPGQSDVFTLPWKRLPRPAFPLDPIADWRS